MKKEICGKVKNRNLNRQKRTCAPNEDEKVMFKVKTPPASLQSYRPVLKKISFLAALLAGLFTFSGVAQYLYIVWKNRITTEAELRPAANQIRQELAFTNAWNLSGFRHSEFATPTYFVLTQDGFLIELGDFIPGLIERAAPIADSIYDNPTTIVSPVGEKWRLFGKKVDGGRVVVGILDLDDELENLEAADRLIRREAEKFGRTLDEARRVKTRDTPAKIDYAVLDDAGELKAATSFIPLRILAGAVLYSPAPKSSVKIDGNSYFLLRTPIVNEAGKLAGQIVMVKDISAGERAVKSLGWFNFGLSAICWLVVVIVLGVGVVESEVARRKLEISLEEALRQGEGQNIEFKEGISMQNLPPAISAFANTNPGVIFVGVRDNREICGVVATTLQEEDRVKQKIRDVVQNHVDPLLIPNLKYFEMDGKKVLRVSIPLGDRPPYLGDGIAYRRVLAAVVPAKSDDIRRMR